MPLAESCDLPGIVGERLHVPTDKGSNASGKVATIVAGMVTGAVTLDWPAEVVGAWEDAANMLSCPLRWAAG